MESTNVKVSESMENKRLASKVAIVCYGFGELASQFVWAFVGSYLTIFYTDIVGLAPAVVSAIMLGARVWDAVNDPMMGALAERTRCGLGRFRPYIAFGCPVLVIFSVLTFTNPFSGTSTAGIIWATVTYIIAGMLYTMVNVPYTSLAGVMTEDAGQRSKINASKNIGMNLGRIIVNACAVTLLLKLSASDTGIADERGYMLTAVVFGIISIPLFLTVFFTAKEKIQPVGEIHKFSLKQTIKNLFFNKYLMIVTLVMILCMTAMMGRMSILSYYVIYCLGDFKLMALITTLPPICGIIASFFVPMLISHFGKRNVLMGSLAMQGLGLFIIFMAPFDNLAMVVTGCAVVGLFNMAMPVSLTMVADSVDYMELKTGVRTDGTAYAIYGLATKIGNALGGAGGVMIVGMSGYIANARQSEQTLLSINKAVNLLPAIIMVLSAAACLLWKMKDSEADDIRRRLKENS